MEEISDLRRREVETFIELVQGATTERERRARAFHNLSEYLAEDFSSLSHFILEQGSTASFCFLGRDAERQAETIRQLDQDGHEICVHGARHTSFANLDYETAHNDLSRGMTAIENSSGVTPTGLFPPVKKASEGTLKAAADLGLNWVVARTDARSPSDIAVREWIHPHDTVLLHDGQTPEAAFDELREQATPGTTFLFHPNVLEHYDAIDEFERWISSVRCTSVGEQIENDGVGLLFDCVLAVRVE